MNPKLTFRTFALLAMLATTTFAAHATSIDFDAVASTPLNPSADSFSLNAASSPMSSTATQSGTFVVGDSGWLEGDFGFSFVDNVTIAGVTSAVTLYGDDYVTWAYDTLSIYASGPVQIGDATWSLRPFQVTGNNIQPYDMSLTADVTPGITPEPAGLLLLGTGALATALTVRRRMFALQ